MIGIFYAALFVWQVMWFVSAIRRKKGWVRLLILCAMSMAAAFGCMWYFDVLPGYGIMPGWAYFQEVFYSLCAGVAYFIMTLIAALGALLQKK